MFPSDACLEKQADLFLIIDKKDTDSWRLSAHSLTGMDER
jgi:hypothetical protein